MKKLRWCLVLCLCLGTLSLPFLICSVCSGHPEETHYQWKFAKVEPGRRDAGKVVRYYVELANIGTQHETRTSIAESELQLLTQYFGVKTIEDLEGKIFEAVNGHPLEALNQLAVQVKHNGNYKSPTPEELYDRAAHALAKMELPDFSDVYEKDVLSAFSVLYPGEPLNEEINKDWLNDFEKKIYKYSNGNVTLSNARSGDFHMAVKGTATYLRLRNKKTGEVKPVIIGPYSNAINFGE